MQQIIPIIVTTMEALEAASAEGWPVIYVDEGLYRVQASRIRERMARHHYALFWKRGRKGVFFLLTQGERRFDHDRHVIHDPAGIL